MIPEWNDFDWGYRDGLANAPWPEFLPPPAYFEGRIEGARQRRREQERALAA